MKNYFDKLQDKVSRYSKKYQNKPAYAAARLAMWNLGAAIKKHKKPTPVKNDSNEIQKTKIQPDVLRIAIAEGGGMGDDIIQIAYIKQIRKMFTRPVIIDFYCNAYKAFQDFPFIDNCYPYPKHNPTDDYDVYLVSRRFYIVCKIDEEKTKQFCPKFYEFCMHCKNITDNVLCGEYNDNLYTQYALQFNKNRQEQSNVHDIIDVNRYTPKYTQWNESEFKFLDAHDLEPQKYITISRACASMYDNSHPKLWPLEYYNELTKMLKDTYPDIKIVQIGASSDFSVLENIDKNLLGKTNLDQTKVLLKNALLHIDGEGGLVHLRNSLYGKSVVIFGPTDPRVFGYEENINLRSKVCPHACEWITRTWTNGCIRGHKTPLCMSEMKPEIVFNAIRTHLDTIPQYSYTVSEADKIESNTPDRLIAQIGRTDQKFTRTAPKGKLTVYANDLSEPDETNSKNCQYFHFAKSKGFDAEYGTIYNIPSHDTTYDIVYNCDIDNCKNPSHALRESLRIVKKGGNLYIRATKGNIALASEYFNKKINTTKKYICINKKGN